MMSPRPSSSAVSIVLPAFNRAGSIRMAVESVLQQSFSDFELLVVDDGSTDGTMAQLAEITDPRVQLLANPRNIGASAARNTGIRAARGDWVAFQDSDDEWLPQKLAKQMERLAAEPGKAIACYCGMAIVGAPENIPGSRTTIRYIPDQTIATVEGNLLEQLLARSFISTQTLVVRRTALLEIGGFDEAQLARVDAVAQLGEQRQAVHARAVVLRVVEHDVQRRVLGLVERDVGTPQQLGVVLAVLGPQRDTDAGAEWKLGRNTE